MDARSLCRAQPFGPVKSTDTAQGRDALSYGFYFSVPQGGTRAPPVTARFIRASMDWEPRCTLRWTVEEHRQMPAPQWDILRRERDGSFIWMEAAQDLNTAKARLEELIAAAPGEYFVFDQRSQEIVAKL